MQGRKIYRLLRRNEGIQTMAIKQKKGYYFSRRDIFGRYNKGHRKFHGNSTTEDVTNTIEINVQGSTTILIEHNVKMWRM